MPGPLSNVPQVLGTTRVYRVTLAGPDGQPVTAGSFSGSEAFSVPLRQGADGPALATLAAAWDDDPNLAGNPSSIDYPAIKVTALASAIAGLTPGSYAATILIDPGVNDVEAWSGYLRIVAGGGTTPAPRTYADLVDLVDAASWIEDVEDLAEGLSTNFIRELAEATRWLDRQVMARVRKVLESQRSRHGAILLVPPIVLTSGVDGGPTYGPSTIPDTTLRDQESAFRGYLEAGFLMTGDADPSNLDGGAARRMTALYALHLILRDEVGKLGDTPFQALAARFRREAIHMLIGWIARIDTDADGVANYEIA